MLTSFFHPQDHATRAATAAVVDAMTSNGDPKWQKSELLQFMSQVAQGELEFKDNKVRKRRTGFATIPV